MQTEGKFPVPFSYRASNQQALSSLQHISKNLFEKFMETVSKDLQELTICDENIFVI